MICRQVHVYTSYYVIILCVVNLMIIAIERIKQLGESSCNGKLVFYITANLRQMRAQLPTISLRVYQYYHWLCSYEMYNGRMYFCVNVFMVLQQAIKIYINKHFCYLIFLVFSSYRLGSFSFLFRVFLTVLYFLL